MRTAIGLQHQCIEALIRKRAIEKLRRAGDISHEQAKQMEAWLSDVSATLSIIKQNPEAIREILKRSAS